jgi:amino-acid N-acetyltransferase
MNVLALIKVGASGLDQLRQALRQAALPWDHVGAPDRQFYRVEVEGKWVAFGGVTNVSTGMRRQSPSAKLPSSNIYVRRRPATCEKR